MRKSFVLPLIFIFFISFTALPVHADYDMPLDININNIISNVYTDAGPDTNASTACGDEEFLSGSNTCIPLTAWWNLTYNVTYDANIDTDTNASTACSDEEFLTGSGTCMALTTWWNVTYNVTYDSNIDTDTNASTACGDEEFLTGSDTCMGLTAWWNVTYNETYDANIDTDTNASTACDDEELLSGSGGCIELKVDWNTTYNATYDGVKDTNASTACSTDEVLDGTGNCVANYNTTITWASLTGYDLNVDWSNSLNWGNLTGFDLNNIWSGTLGGGNITADTITGTQVDESSLVMQSDWYNTTDDVRTAQTDTNASSACSDEEFLTGSGTCMGLTAWWNVTYNATYDANIDTDTNASTACSDEEFLTGSGTCMALTAWWNVTYNATYDGTLGTNTTDEIRAAQTDTNASSACDDEEVLSGSGGCVPLVNYWNNTYNATYDGTLGTNTTDQIRAAQTDTNASSACGDEEFLSGSGTCMPLITDWNITYNATYDGIKDTNASTGCGDEEFLSGSGGCVPLVNYWNVTYNATYDSTLGTNTTDQIRAAQTDTNSSTACGDEEFLTGSGTCMALTTWWNVTYNATYDGIKDTNASIACSAGSFLDGGGECRNINETIDNRTLSTTYNASGIVTVTGTLDDGDLDSIIIPEDSDSYNVTEDVGGYPVLTIDINFTGVQDFDTIIGRIWYSGSAGHEVQLEIWRTDTHVWENYEEYTDMTDFVNIHIPIYDTVNHIDASNNVSIRFDHAQSGLPSHEFYIDYLALVDGWTALTTSDHDGLGGRDDKANHPWAFPTDGTRNITGDVNITENLHVEKGVNGPSFTDGWNETDTYNATYDGVKDTNASTGCEDEEFLSGSGGCVPLVNYWNNTYNATYDSTLGTNTTDEIRAAQTDTNSSTACGDEEFLSGSGTCIALKVDWNITYNVTYDVIKDTNASIACGDEEFLSGSGGCVPLVSYWNTTNLDLAWTGTLDAGNLTVTSDFDMGSQNITNVMNITFGSDDAWIYYNGTNLIIEG